MNRDMHDRVPDATVVGIVGFEPAPVPRHEPSKHGLAQHRCACLQILLVQRVNGSLYPHAAGRKSPSQRQGPCFRLSQDWQRRFSFPTCGMMERW